MNGIKTAANVFVIVLEVTILKPMIPAMKTTTVAIIHEIEIITIV